MDLTSELKKSSCFAPRILRRQVIDILVKQLVLEDVPSSTADAGPFALALQGISTRLLSPSIRHFHGALLFVDISGFTRLSQKMDVDNLRKFINAYFTKLIDIVSKYDGEVIKFAGDAMYIVWQSKMYGRLSGKILFYCWDHFSLLIASLFFLAMFNIDKDEQIRISLRKASVCAAEIIQVCSNYKVELHGDVANSPALNLNLSIPSKLNSTTSRKASFLIAEGALQQQLLHGGDFLNPADNFVAYLNVHCGLSVGMMSGVDVGCDGRWEYFIVGPPLKEVAEAEECASSGEVMMTDAAHSLIHPKQSVQNEDEIRPIGCHCVLHPRGFWNMEQSGVCGFSSLGRCPSNDSGVMIPDDDEARHNLDLADDLAAGCREYYSAFEKVSKTAQSDRKPMGVGKLAAILQRCLLDHLTLHTHQAVRNIIQLELTNGFESSSESAPNSARSGILSPLGSPAPRRGSRQKSTTFVNRMRELTRADSKTGNVHLQGGGSHKEKGIDIADQREAITCFINIHFSGTTKANTERLHQFLTQEALSLPITPSNFINVTDSNHIQIEGNAMRSYQTSLEVAIECFHRSGGQIRQFIVDDKGTVVIGTFGLRGSVSRDNASSAVDTSLRIISELKLRIDASASIGITSGRVYNGLVGSAYRHEFAVMGPTVNVSARLMGKAPVGTILCDQIVKATDHVHQFVHFADVTAKGYDTPLPVFSPITTTSSMGTLQLQIIEQIARQVDTDHQLHVDTNGGAKSPNSGDFDHYLVGRKAYMSRMNEFLQDLACQKDIWQRILVQERLHSHHIVKSALLAPDPSLTKTSNSDAGVATTSDSKPTFIIDADTRVILLEGIHGSGKSHLLHEVCIRVAKYLDETNFEANIAVHTIPQSRLKHSEPFSGVRPLLDTIMNRYVDWTAKRIFDPVQPVEMSRRTKTKALRSLSALLDKLPEDIQVYIPLFSIVSKHFAADDNETTSSLSPLEKLRHLGNFLFVLLQTFQREINRLLFLNMYVSILMLKRN